MGCPSIAQGPRASLRGGKSALSGM
jgi:hypothetical protein